MLTVVVLGFCERKQLVACQNAEGKNVVGVNLQKLTAQYPITAGFIYPSKTP
jgi:hypothetical protein